MWTLNKNYLDSYAANEAALGSETFSFNDFNK